MFNTGSSMDGTWTAEARTPVRDWDAVWFVRTQQVFSYYGYLGFKRLFDILVGLFMFACLFPLMVVISIVIRMSSPGPAIYCQRRLTQGGKTFTMFKFRTMVADAEQNGQEIWAGEEDPRVTRFGRFMRKMRLDELPQLINVLIGDMSLIGPRPERPELSRQLSKELPGFNKRLQVKAGLTGLAQVAAGYASSTESYRVKLAWDIVYIRNRSILLEVEIALRTVMVILTGFGAR